MSLDLLWLPVATAAPTSALITFLLYLGVIFGLAIISHRMMAGKSFMSEYFLGSRSLGVVAFAMTFAATSASGGTFTGFPSKIYTHGWVLALWIASYMVVPICLMGLLGKRLNRVARISGAITVPDVIRDRFNSRSLGLLAVALVVFFLSFSLVAQFKAGALFLRTLLDDVPIFEQLSFRLLDPVAERVGWLSEVDRLYLSCLLLFGAAVILYTTYGGFHAVVWTDVLQGGVMLLGVLLLLPMTLRLVGQHAPEGQGAMEFATRQLAEMTPPRPSQLELEWQPNLNASSSVAGDHELRAGSWLVLADAGSTPRLFRLEQPLRLETGATPADSIETSGLETAATLQATAWEITTPSEIDRQLARLHKEQEPWLEMRLLQPDLELSPGQLGLRRATSEPYAFGDQLPGVYVTGPGPSRTAASGFLPLSLAISFFFMWSIAGAGQPSNMVRLMAFRDARTLRVSMLTVAIYFTAIYLPLVIIFCLARILLPGMEGESDRVMPALAVYVSSQVGLAWLAGLLVAAPFAAVMSTVDSFLLMISSCLVRDIYQRNLNSNASEQSMRRLSYVVTAVVGVAAVWGAVNPPDFLQDIIVYVGSGLAACFLFPVALALYWPRTTSSGAAAAMIGGFLAHLSLYLAGIWFNGSFFRPIQLFNLDPILLGLIVSLLCGGVVSWLTPPPPAALIRKYFC